MLFPSQEVSSSAPARAAEPARTKPFWMLATAAVSLALILYTGLRAWKVPFTCDESLTYVHAVNRTGEEAFALTFKDANNHPLNTWGMFVSSALFGNSELALRLPNLLAHLLYCFASFALLRRIRSGPAAFALFLAFNLNPFILEYFALARGYGIGLGFMMSSLWLAGEALEAKDDLRAICLGAAAIVAATLSAFANYAFVFYLVPLCPLLVVLRATSYRPDPSDSVPPLTNGKAMLLLGAFTLWSLALCALSLGREIVDLRRREAFYIGGTQGPWEGSVRSIFEASLPALPWLSSPLRIGLALLLAPALFLLAKALLRRRKLPQAGLLFATLLFFAITAFMALAGRLLGVNYLEGRSAILYVPLIVGVFGFVWQSIPRQAPRSVGMLSKGVGSALVLLLCANLARSMNLSTTSEWGYDADTKTMLGDLEREYVTRGNEEKIRLGVDWWLAPTINFYRLTRNLEWLEPVKRKLEGDFDFYYCDVDSETQLEGLETAVVRRYVHSRNVLLGNTSQP